MKKTNQKVRKILAYQFIAMVIFNMAHPVTPTLITTLKYPTYAFGVLFATMSTMSFFTAPLWGQLADKIGRRKVLFIGPFGSAIGQLGFGLSTKLGWTIFFRAFTGSFAMATVMVSLVYLNSVVDDEHKGKQLSYSAGLTGVGSMLGYLLGGLISDHGYRYTFFVQVGLLLLLPLLVIILLEKDAFTSTNGTNIISPIKLLGKVRNYIAKPIGIYFVIMFLMSSGFTIYNTTIPFYLNTIWGFPPSLIGYFMTFTGILGLFANMVLLTRLIRRYKTWVLLLFEAFILCLCLFLLTFVQGLVFLIPILITYLVFLPMYRPLNHTLIAKEAKQDEGVVFGIMNSFNSLGMIFGSLFAGFAFKLWESLPFIIAAVIFGMTGVLILINKSFKKRKRLPYGN